MILPEFNNTKKNTNSVNSLIALKQEKRGNFLKIKILLINGEELRLNF